jgi:hypothetical protein
MMTFISLIAILLSLFGQGLTFSAPHTWSFTGTVIETRQVFVMGMVSQVALVQSPDFDAWVIQRMESQTNELPEIVLGNAAVGDQVRVSITGPHVSKNGVDWVPCEPLYSNYCRQGGMYDTGPIADDWNMPISPSNEFIHYRNSSPSIAYPLFWNTEVLKHAPALKRETCSHRSSSQTGRAHPCACWVAANHVAAGLCRLVGQAFGRGYLEPQ